MRTTMYVGGDVCELVCACVCGGIRIICNYTQNESAVGIATGYGLDDQGA
jgi:hypothetical protein